MMCQSWFRWEFSCCISLGLQLFLPGFFAPCVDEAAFLRHCRMNFEYDIVKTVALAHIDFWHVTGL